MGILVLLSLLVAVFLTAPGCAKKDANGRMTRAEYRKERHTQGRIEKDQDVCHIIASANGGADHPDNYEACGAGWNRSIGNSYDHLNCYMAGLHKCEKAVAVSRNIGSHTPKSIRHKKYSGLAARELYIKGQNAMRDVRHVLRDGQKHREL